MEHKDVLVERAGGRKLVSVPERQGHEVVLVTLTTGQACKRNPLSVLLDPHGVTVYKSGREGDRTYFPWSSVRSIDWYFEEV